ncbi:MAG: 16S rRNA (guanine(966)-N(2))-methyltransferase RsmD [Chloroflexi bacterium]|nr:16S rRNA (guanine(966)-N(2))-methyltransferase RsmD [Chloroflexota bacterium]
MRVISGTARGRTLKSPGEATRPITDRAKTSLFNILGTRVIDADVLDLFAGAGSVGIEALSRGARRATFVELDRAALQTIRDNLALTKLADRASVVRQDVFKFIAQSAATRYDVIYVAPPQYKGLWSKTLVALDDADLLADRGTLVAQIHPKEYRDLALKQFALVDQRKYGSTLLCFYQKVSASSNLLT